MKRRIHEGDNMKKDSVKELEKRVEQDIKDYGLLDKKDRILVAASGGKDSTTVIYMLKRLGYNVEALIIDLAIGDYSDKNLENLRNFCKKNKVKLHVVSIRDYIGSRICYIRSILSSAGDDRSSCSICGVVKRYILNRKARELGFTKLATGHNLDDEAQTVLMNIMNGTMDMGIGSGPILDYVDDKFVPRIKPLYFIPEKDVRKYSEKLGFSVVYERCPCSFSAQRAFLRKQLNEMETKHPGTKLNIVRSFLKTQPSLRRIDRGKLNYCSNCGEPSKNIVCNTCKIMKKVAETR